MYEFDRASTSSTCTQTYIYTHAHEYADIQRILSSTKLIWCQHLLGMTANSKKAHKLKEMRKRQQKKK